MAVPGDAGCGTGGLSVPMCGHCCPAAAALAALHTAGLQIGSLQVQNFVLNLLYVK